MEKKEKCCICKKTIIGHAKKALPLVPNGKCCINCHSKFVIPSRFVNRPIYNK